MSAAKKCDICGSLYEIYNVKKNPSCPNGIMLVNIDEIGSYHNNPVNDCCPTCMITIKETIEKLKKEKENEYE